mmetsp:Transcript_3472/g.9200  ORF Transcript_3472/g.9200 Transcript_3472/m.9200 type:complete len:108 (+) Transcript_3472:1053-1376(+)
MKTPRFRSREKKRGKKMRNLRFGRARYRGFFLPRRNERENGPGPRCIVPLSKNSLRASNKFTTVRTHLVTHSENRGGTFSCVEYLPKEGICIDVSSRIYFYPKVFFL